MSIPDYAPPVIEASALPAEAAVVVVVHGLASANFSVSWFLQSDILKPEELTGQIISTEDLVEIPTPHFHLQIIKNRIQLKLLTPEGHAKSGELFERVVVGFLRKAGNLHARALGINFTFFVTDDEQPFGDWNRENFASPFAARFADVSDARFGCYFSKNIDEFRLKVDVKPTLTLVAKTKEGHGEEPKQQELMRFNLNFHCDMKTPEGPDRVWASLRKYPKFLIDGAALVVNK